MTCKKIIKQDMTVGMGFCVISIVGAHYLQLLLSLQLYTL